MNEISESNAFDNAISEYNSNENRRFVAVLSAKLKLSNLNALICACMILSICISTYRAVIPNFTHLFDSYKLSKRALIQQSDYELHELKLMNNFALYNLQSAEFQVITTDNGDRIILLYYCESTCYHLNYMLLIFRLNEFIVLSSTNDFSSDQEILSIDNSTITNTSDFLKQHLNVTSSKNSYINILSKQKGNLFDKSQVLLNIEYDLTLNKTNTTSNFISNISNIQAKIKTNNLYKYNQELAYSFNLPNYNAEGTKKIGLQARANMFNTFYSLILLLYFITLRNVILEFQSNPEEIIKVRI